MIEKQLLSDQFIVNCLQEDYDIAVATLTFLPLGADMNASLYKAQTKDQISYFVKLKLGHHHDISVMILKLLHDAGIQEIIPPVQTILGQFTHRIQDYTLIVYPFVMGENGFTRDLSDHQWVKLGKAMRQVHEIDLPPSIHNQLRKEVYSPQWRNAVRSLFMQMDALPISDETALKLGKFMKENRLRICQIVERAEQLGQKLQTQSPKFVLCHSDVHGGNVLMDGNDSIYIIDWDEPILAPKERDLMFIGGGVANVWNKPNEEKLFYSGYGNTEVNSTILTYYRYERIVEDIAIYGNALLLTTVGGADRLDMYRHFIAMFKPRGVVDIAIETDENLGNDP